MKKIFLILIIIAFQYSNAQSSIDKITQFYQLNKTEKVYLQLNNVLYEPEEVVHYKIYVTNADNSPSNWSDYVYVSIFDASNKKIDTQTYMVKNGNALGSFRINEEMASGIYKIKAYTQWQNILLDAPFETSFFIQKVVSPRVLMSLEFKKKGYGKGETCLADFELKTIENIALKNFRFKYEVFISGQKYNVLSGQTDQNGKATLQFQLPELLTKNDGIINVLVDYDNYQESVTRSIPINLNFVDLQFLPESGHYINNESCNIYFIAKNEFGLPLDISGNIIDQNGNTITTFNSLHDGMGLFSIQAKNNEAYFAKITSPFESVVPISLPKAEENVFVINGIDNEKGQFKIYAPLDTNAQIFVRNTDKIYKIINTKLKQGWNEMSIDPTNFPVGIQNISLLIDEKIVAEKLLFLNNQKGLHIDIKTDKPSYLPREKIKVTVTTLDNNNKPIPSNISVSVIDNKLLTYINDKQHNILSWILLGYELKGKVNEPSFYFDEKNELNKRQFAIDLLLNTHGWRKFNQEDIVDLKYPQTQFKPEKSSDVEGFLTNKKNKPISAKILLFTDDEKVYETKSNNKGYFKFTKTHFNDFAYLVIENKSKKEIKITNSFSDYKDFVKMADLINKKDSGMLLRPVKNKSNILKNVNIVENKNLRDNESDVMVKQGKDITLENENNKLEECVVIGYGGVKRKDITSSVSAIKASEISNIETALSGKVAGLVIQSGSGQPGNNAKIMIRGNSSIYGSRANSQPLIVIDGIPSVNNENANVLGSLSPNDINDITVLKDASATAIYGNMGSNGVIIVTTKKANINQVNGIAIGQKSNYTTQAINKYNTKKLTAPEKFYVPVYETTVTNEKTDFRNCIYWNGIIHTNKEGIATFDYYNSDDNTSFKIIAEGISYKGDVGRNHVVYNVSEAFQTDVKIPLYTTVGDSILLPLRVKNTTNKQMNLTATLRLPNQITATTKTYNFSFQPNESKVCYFPIEATQIGQKLPIGITLQGEDYQNTIQHTIDIYAKGFPVSIDISGTKSGNEVFQINNMLPNTLQSGFKIYFNPFSEITNGLQSMLREPSGCFEQVSSSNYPNIMALQLLSQTNTINEDFKNTALGFLKNGYQKLKNYESKDGGFEWYGGNPGHEALTAYGLLQFNEMKQFIDIDKSLFDRSIKWLYSRKDNNGGFKLNQGKYGFSSVKNEVNNAYITYVLSEINEKNNQKENEAVYKEAIKSQDLYRVVLCALTSYNTGNLNRYNELNDIFRKEVSKKGFKEIKAQQTIVNSYGNSLSVELASLYALSLMKENKITKEIDEAISFIQSSKSSYGFGSTQATALALKAITNYTIITKAKKIDGSVALQINQQPINCNQKDSNGNVSLTSIQGIQQGNNNIDIQIDNNENIPYLFYLQYQTSLPVNSKDCLIDINTQLLQSKINLSQTARLEIDIKNKSNEVVSNPIARIGIPGGTTIEPWQLKELIEKEKVDYYEIFGNELVLYFRHLGPKEIKEINIDLKAIIPGIYTGVASSAYLYYNNEHKNWNKGLYIEIEK
jgi:alpha-2-macroglobulin-like protein